MFISNIFISINFVCFSVLPCSICWFYFLRTLSLLFWLGMPIGFCALLYRWHSLTPTHIAHKLLNIWIDISFRAATLKAMTFHLHMMLIKTWLHTSNRTQLQNLKKPEKNEGNKRACQCMLRILSRCSLIIESTIH